MPDSQVAELEPQDESIPEAAVEQAPAEPEARPQGPPCAHCGVPGDGTTWCRSCGWVPHLKTFVAVDQEAEAAAVSDQPQSTELRFSDIVPPWTWVLVGSVLGVLAVSVLGKLLTPAYSVPRVFWVVGQLLIGLLVFGVAHFRSYLQAITDNAQLAVTDVFIKPLAVWLPTRRSSAPSAAWWA
jgi:hypothetical protein